MTVADIRDTIKPLMQSFGVKRAALFGSQARGQGHTKSDVDILVELKAGSSLLDLVHIEQALSKKLRRRVDLVTYRSLHPRIRRQIRKDMRTII